MLGNCIYPELYSKIAFLPTQISMELMELILTYTNRWGLFQSMFIPNVLRCYFLISNYQSSIEAGNHNAISISVEYLCVCLSIHRVGCFSFQIELGLMLSKIVYTSTCKYTETISIVPPPSLPSIASIN